MSSHVVAASQKDQIAGSSGVRRMTVAVIATERDAAVAMDAAPAIATRRLPGHQAAMKHHAEAAHESSAHSSGQVK